MLCAAAAWLLSEPVALRVLVAAAAAAAVTGAFLTRSWDRAAGRQVADLTRGRASDAWQTEERIAELESELEESRELRAKLDAKLRAKRVELAGLRGEHAALLRRYATAETERASVLEDRRQLTGDTGATKVPGPARAAAALGPAVYLRAARALEELTRTAGAQRSARTTAGAQGSAVEKASAGEAEESPGKPRAGVDTGPEQHARPATALPARRPAAAIAPYGPRRGPGAARPEGTFDFFGTQAVAPGEPGSELRAAPEPERRARAIEAAQQEDLADVVGEEALAERRADTARPAAAVIDLTAHDETEKLDLGELRNAVNS
ncbi:hypothetical protein GCM10010387_00600 [Streptomyces inusitatus]|uniref:Secreted protein n=1 Tax=Streptomyces inusitatus TaxID=68221 RepID=A0A918PK99_9ACTN|nr:hypothetical protein GCM10010387_00600 [Streptomyces inusitatus]